MKVFSPDNNKSSTHIFKGLTYQIGGEDVSHGFAASVVRAVQVYANAVFLAVEWTCERPMVKRHPLNLGTDIALVVTFRIAG